MIGLLIVALLGSYQQVLQADLITHGKVRWSKMDAGARVTVEIEGGNAKRTNPNWSPVPQNLPYDLARERTLARDLKSAKLPAPNHASAREDWRTLEVLVEDAHTGWHSAGTWSMSVKAWQKGRYGSIYEALEPLLDVKPELYGTQGATQRP
jgi:hypothetical protein